MPGDEFRSRIENRRPCIRPQLNMPGDIRSAGAQTRLARRPNSRGPSSPPADQMTRQKRVWRRAQSAPAAGSRG